MMTAIGYVIFGFKLHALPVEIFARRINVLQRLRRYVVSGYVEKARRFASLNYLLRELFFLLRISFCPATHVYYWKSAPVLALRCDIVSS